MGRRRGPEGKIQDAVITHARKVGLLYKKNEVGKFFVQSGWPDYAFYPGEGSTFFVEFKAPGGALTPLQEHVRKEIETRGYKYYVVDSVNYGKIVIDQECE